MPTLVACLTFERTSMPGCLIIRFFLAMVGIHHHSFSASQAASPTAGGRGSTNLDQRFSDMSGSAVSGHFPAIQETTSFLLSAALAESLRDLPHRSSGTLDIHADLDALRTQRLFSRLACPNTSCHRQSRLPYAENARLGIAPSHSQKPAETLLRPRSRHQSLSTVCLRASCPCTFDRVEYKARKQTSHPTEIPSRHYSYRFHLRQTEFADEGYL